MYLHEINPMLPLWHGLPMFKEIFPKRFTEFKASLFELLQSIELNIDERIEYNEENEMSLFDTIKFERDKLVERNESYREELSDASLVWLVHDLIFGSIETSANTLSWMLLLMKCNPEHELRLRGEISKIIGNRNPTLQDKAECHFVMAFLSETLRFRNITHLAVPHLCLQDYKHGIDF